MNDLSSEILRRDITRGRYRAVLFDFDGTLSLLREGWHRVMISMMVEGLAPISKGEPEAVLSVLVEDFVMALNGRPAIFQMARFVEEMKRRGGCPESPADYLLEYDRRLHEIIRKRIAEIQEGCCPRDRWVVPGSYAILDALRKRGLKLYLASGTQMRFVRPEAEFLGLTPYFDREIHAPEDNDATFAKRIVIERILAENKISGEELLGFGDGVVEIEEIRRVGGTAIAVASDEVPGGINRWKRDRLVQAGADVVIADYRQSKPLLTWLFDEVS